jgi:hypothetical protein
MRPMTVRQVFYQASVRGIVEKTEEGYRKVLSDLTVMRRNGEMPYNWLADSTRWQRRPTTYSGPREALEETAKFYRKRLWKDIDAYVEIWLEKEALAGVVVDVTDEFDVPLMVSRGYASLSFLASSAEDIKEQDRPCYIYHFGDFDPSGINAGEKIEETLREMAPNAEINFERLAVTEKQIAEWDLPTRPTKQTDSRAKNHGDISVELDAIDPDRLRQLVRDVIEIHLPQDKFEVLKAAEESERRLLNLAALNFEEDEEDDYDDDVDEEPEPEPQVPPFYQEALDFIGNFTGTAGALNDWFRSKRTERNSLMMEQQTVVSRAYNAKFNALINALINAPYE